MPHFSLYGILEVCPTARLSVIRAAYRCLVQEYHPDKNPGDAAAADRMTMINHAYSVLADPLLRQQYDSKIKQRATDLRGAVVTSKRARPDAGKGDQTMRPFVFRPLD